MKLATLVLSAPLLAAGLASKGLCANVVSTFCLPGVLYSNFISSFRVHGPAVCKLTGSDLLQDLVASGISGDALCFSLWSLVCEVCDTRTAPPSQYCYMIYPRQSVCSTGQPSKIMLPCNNTLSVKRNIHGAAFVVFCLITLSPNTLNPKPQNPKP